MKTRINSSNISCSKMNKRDNDCDIKYIPNIEYDINYKVDLDNIGILNYFYRSRY